MWTYKVSGDELTMTTPTGQSYTAKLNGPEAPCKGDPGTTSVAVKMMGKNTLEETDYRDGKPISVAKTVVCSRWQNDEAYGGRQTARDQERIYGDETVMRLGQHHPLRTWRVGSPRPQADAAQRRLPLQRETGSHA